MGWNSQPTTLVSMEDVRVPQENLLGEKGLGFKYNIKIFKVFKLSHLIIRSFIKKSNVH